MPIKLLKLFANRRVDTLSNILENRRLKRAFNANKELRKIYEIFTSSPEGGWIIGKNDAVKLYETVKKYAPKNILDIGGGIGASGSILALAGGNGSSITSVEPFQKCVEIAARLTPANLAPRIKMFHCPSYAWKYDRLAKYLYFSNLKNLPFERGPFDFVVVDGPGYWLEDGQFVDLPNGDLFTLIPYLAPGCKIYVDGRKQAVGFYKRFLNNYLSVIEDDATHTIFERNSRPAKSLDDMEFSDLSKEKEIKTKYFN